MKRLWCVVASGIIMAAVALFASSFFAPVALAGDPITFNVRPRADKTTRWSIHVTWKTGDELQTAGYNLYRSNRKDGGYEKINAHLIPASTDVIAGGQYAFEDRGVQPGQSLYYRLEIIDLNGHSKRLEAQLAVWSSMGADAAPPASPAAAEGGVVAALVTGAIAGLWRLVHG